MVPITTQSQWLQVIDGKVEYARQAFDIRLWKWLASSSPRLWKWLCNHVLQLMQLRLTVYGNG